MAVERDTKSTSHDPPRIDAAGSGSRLARLIFRSVEPDLVRWTLALGIVVVIALVRAPYTQIPDALFVSDGFGYYIYLPSVFIDHDLDLSNQIPRIPYEGNKPYFHVSPETGRRTDQFPIGSAVLWAPFFLVADLFVMSLRASGAEIERSGFGYWYELPVYVGSAAFGLWAILLIQRSLRRMFSASISLVSLFAVVVATPLAYYCLVEPNMSHTVAMFAISLWVWRLQRTYEEQDVRWTTWIVLGLILGVVALIRPYNGLLGLVAIPVALAIFSGRTADSLSGRQLCAAFLRLSICCLSMVAVFMLQMSVWKWLYGNWIVAPRGSGYEEITWLNPTLVSYLSSVFLFSPLYGLAILGLVLGGRWWPRAARLSSLDEPSRAPDDDTVADPQFAQLVAPWMVLVLILVSVLVAATREWFMGTSFGNRRFVDWSIFIAYGAALLLTMVQRRFGDRRFMAAEWCVLFLAAVHSLFIVLYLLKLGVLPEYGLVL